jgi:hypothetical protein
LIRKKLSSSPANVLVVRTADSLDFDYSSLVNVLNKTFLWSVFVQRQMGASLVVIIHVTSKKLPDVSLAQYDQVIEALSADTTDHTLGIDILPGRVPGSRNVLYPNSADLALKGSAIEGISIREKELRGMVGPTHLEELASCPFG